MWLFTFFVLNLTGLNFGQCCSTLQKTWEWRLLKKIHKRDFECLSCEKMPYWLKFHPYCMNSHSCNTGLSYHVTSKTWPLTFRNAEREIITKIVFIFNALYLSSGVFNLSPEKFRKLVWKHFSLHGLYIMAVLRLMNVSFEQCKHKKTQSLSEHKYKKSGDIMLIMWIQNKEKVQFSLMCCNKSWNRSYEKHLIMLWRPSLSLSYFNANSVCVP